MPTKIFIDSTGPGVQILFLTLFFWVHWLVSLSFVVLCDFPNSLPFSVSKRKAVCIS